MRLGVTDEEVARRLRRHLPALRKMWQSDVVVDHLWLLEEGLRLGGQVRWEEEE